MGALWSVFQDDRQLFFKSAYLPYSDDGASGRGGYSSRFAFYQALKQAVTRMELAKVLRSPTAGKGGDDGDMEAEDRAHVNFMLAHWPREMDIVYDRHNEFPFSLSIERELEASAFAPPATASAQPSNAPSGVVASKEEAILKGLCENKLSSSEAIHQAMAQLKQKCRGDTDQFLRILAKYPRATRLYVSQELHARSNVENAFQLYLIEQDYARAAHTVGKLAYGEESSRVKKKLKRLQEMSKLLQQAVDQKAPSHTDSTARANPHIGSRSKDSFNQVMTDETIALLQCQSNLQSALGVEYLVGSSLIETLHKLFALYPTHSTVFSMAVELAEQFDVHPRQFSWALLKVLAQTEQWQTLLVITAAARPAIGYIPVIELLLDEDHADLAHDLLALIDAPHEREEIMALLAKYHAQSTGSGGGSGADKDEDVHTYTFHDDIEDSAPQQAL
ncbi:hypothetical protein Gpo141_00009237 [Globisporangium polare]